MQPQSTQSQPTQPQPLQSSQIPDSRSSQSPMANQPNSGSPYIVSNSLVRTFTFLAIFCVAYSFATFVLRTFRPTDPGTLRDIFDNIIFIIGRIDIAVLLVRLVCLGFTGYTLIFTILNSSASNIRALVVSLISTVAAFVSMIIF